MNTRSEPGWASRLREKFAPQFVPGCGWTNSHSGQKPVNFVAITNRCQFRRLDLRKLSSFS